MSRRTVRPLLPLDQALEQLHREPDPEVGSPWRCPAEEAHIEKAVRPIAPAAEQLSALWRLSDGEREDFWRAVRDRVEAREHEARQEVVAS
jgi:hypothetical protein